jgi:hypothetical protein
MTLDRDGVQESIDCPKQRIIPHDMVHLLVESTLRRRGFLTRVVDGEGAAYRMAPDAESDGVERFVEVIQGDAWSGGTSPAAEMLDLYVLTCGARDCAPLPVTADDIDVVRDAMRALDAQWQAVPVGGVLELQLEL